jgi:hypothetical protein
MLAYGVAGDLVDEYMRMSESTCIEDMYIFCQAIISVFGEVFARAKLAGHSTAVVHQREERVSRYAWKHRLYALGVEELPFCMVGQYSGHAEGCRVILEAVASQNLWIWHSFFGIAGSHNDINVLQ